MKKDWNTDVQGRIDATWAFCDYLKKHPEERPGCNNSDTAKKLLARLGNFYVEGDSRDPGDENLSAIPRQSEFRVYDFDPKMERDKLVSIVLPDSKKPLPPADEFDATEIWRCSWQPYFE